jgi:protein-tyrosine phosphatase
MGGAHSLTGDLLEPFHLGSSWVIDCAGDLSPDLRAAAARFLPLVFPDLDGPLSAQHRVDATVSSAVAAMTSDAPPQHLYVMCTHGMNRSGLVAGLILRGLGFGARETVERIRSARPGSLSNDHFRLMLLAD